MRVYDESKKDYQIWSKILVNPSLLITKCVMFSFINLLSFRNLQEIDIKWMEKLVFKP